MQTNIKYIREEIKPLFWNAAEAYNKMDFKQTLDDLELALSKATKDFLSQNSRLFCRAFMGTTCKCDYVIDSMVGTFNT